jgi:hypothetical protein
MIREKQLQVIVRDNDVKQAIHELKMRCNAKPVP